MPELCEMLSLPSPAPGEGQGAEGRVTIVPLTNEYLEGQT